MFNQHIDHYQLWFSPRKIIKASLILLIIVIFGAFVGISVGAYQSNEFFLFIWILGTLRFAAPLVETLVLWLMGHSVKLDKYDERWCITVRKFGHK
jgi:hypothetical protein